MILGLWKPQAEHKLNRLRNIFSLYLQIFGPFAPFFCRASLPWNNWLIIGALDASFVHVGMRVAIILCTCHTGPIMTLSRYRTSLQVEVRDVQDAAAVPSLFLWTGCGKMGRGQCLWEKRETGSGRPESVLLRDSNLLGSIKMYKHCVWNYSRSQPLF